MRGPAVLGGGTHRCEVQQSWGEEPTDARVSTAAEALPRERRSESYIGPSTWGSFTGKVGLRCLALKASRASFQETQGLGQIETPLLKAEHKASPVLGPRAEAGI